MWGIAHSGCLDKRPTRSRCGIARTSPTLAVGKSPPTPTHSAVSPMKRLQRHHRHDQEDKPCPHRAQRAGLRGLELDQAMDRMTAALGAPHPRLSRLRRLTLRALLATGRPQRAYALGPLIDAADPPPVSSIYRSLAALIEVGAVKRLVRSDRYFAVDPALIGKPTATLLCDCCGSVQLDEAIYLNVLDRIPSASGQVHEVIVEITGRCRKCA